MKTINLFTLKELPKESVETAIEEYVDKHKDKLYVHDIIIEGFTEELKEIGITNVVVNYSGFFSQGDGLSFTGRVEDMSLFNKALKLDLKDDDIVEFVRISHKYFHENTVRTHLELDTIDERYDAIQEKIESFRKAKCHEYYKRLEKYYYECTSFENVKEFLLDEGDDNAYFTKNGKLIYNI